MGCREPVTVSMTSLSEFWLLSQGLCYLVFYSPSSRPSVIVTIFGSSSSRTWYSESILNFFFYPPPPHHAPFPHLLFASTSHTPPLLCFALVLTYSVYFTLFPFGYYLNWMLKSFYNIYISIRLLNITSLGWWRWLLCSFWLVQFMDDFLPCLGLRLAGVLVAVMVVFGDVVFQTWPSCSASWFTWIWTPTSGSIHVHLHLLRNNVSNPST